MFRTLSESEGDIWTYAECDSLQELLDVTSCQNSELILLNYHPATMPWAKSSELMNLAMPKMAVWHEANQTQASSVIVNPFDALICLDPTLIFTNPRLISGPRFIKLPDQRRLPANPIFTVGSFGFATANKGFERLCGLVNAEFDQAKIRINIPRHDSEDMVSQSQIETTVTACRLQISKPDIVLELTHKFLDDAGLYKFLARNDLNAFLYDDASERGISSCIDYALSVRRPIAVSGSSMFRSLRGLESSVSVEDSSLREIAARGDGVLEPVRRLFVEPVSGRYWNLLIKAALERIRGEKQADSLSQHIIQLEADLAAAKLGSEALS
jgi:hypothetical protein